MGVQYGDTAKLIFTLLDKVQSTPTFIVFQSNLKLLMYDTIPANKLSCEYSLGTTTQNNEYKITTINSISTDVDNTNRVEIKECVEPKLLKYLNSTIDTITFNYDVHITTITTNTGKISLKDDRVKPINSQSDIDVIKLIKGDTINRVINHKNGNIDGHRIILSSEKNIFYITIN